MLHVRNLFLVSAIVAMTSPSFGALTLTEIDLSSGEIEVTNIGSGPISGALLEWCIPFSYGQMESGSFTFAPGEVRTYSIGGPLNAADDLWIYQDRVGGFGNVNFVETGAVWGSNQAGQGRVNAVVNQTGGAAWASNTDFIDTSGLGPGQTLQAIVPGDAANMSSGWTIGESNLGSFGLPTPSADFDGDGILDCNDVNALCSDIANDLNTAVFDLTGDGAVNSDDLNEWLAAAGAVNNSSGNPYIRGDANLDGVVDVADFNVWNNSKFQSNVSYCDGDFNCDGVVDVADFNVWNASKFQSSNDTVAVPEPTGLLLMVVGLGLGLMGRKSRRDS